MFKTNRILALPIILVGLSITASIAQARPDNGRDLRQRCHAMRNPFVLNKANVNAFVATSCAALSYVENERHELNYENSATMFHQWSTTGSGQKIRVQGHCAVPYGALMSGDIERHKIDLTFSDKSTSKTKMAIKVEGTIAGKTADLNFSNNQFLDNKCSNGEAYINRLERVTLGIGMNMTSIMDMLKSQRTGVTLSLLETESWIQGNVSGYYSGLGLQYRMSQVNGRQTVLAVSSSGSQINIRSAAALDYYEAGDYFAMNEDSFGAPTGFSNERLANNHKFQSYSIADGAQLIGCSSLIFDGELDRSPEADIESCKRKMEQSVFKQHIKRRMSAPVSRPVVLTPEEIQARAEQRRKQEIIARVQNLISKMELAQNYSNRPGVYETSRVAWNKEQRERGYVIVNRAYVISDDGTAVMIQEIRLNTKGEEYKKSITVQL